MKAGDKVWVSDVSEADAKKCKAERFFVRKTSQNIVSTMTLDGLKGIWTYAIPAEGQQTEFILGERIEVSADEITWPRRKYLATTSLGRVVAENSEGHAIEWAFARKLRRTEKRVKSIQNILKWMSEQEISITAKDNLQFPSSGGQVWVSDMWNYCGKSPANKYMYPPEWLEEVEVDNE